MRKTLIAANWKMNGNSGSISDLLAGMQLQESLPCEVLVCPPSLYLGQVAAALASSSWQLGAQNVSEYAAGAYTGEISAEMLVDIGCQYAVVGHSERRALFGESNAQVAAKTKAALAQGIVPILCVGETLEQREAGQAAAIVVAQLQAVIDVIGLEALAQVVIAYEPVWAIGTGLTATPAEANELPKALRAHVAKLSEACADALRILYGGSVKPANAAELLAESDIDGLLVGGASLQSADFMAICQAAN